MGTSIGGCDKEYMSDIQNGSGFVTKDSGKRQEFETGARRDIQTGKGRYDLLPKCAIHRYAQLLERGAEKYGDHNWEKGIPSSRYMSSLLRHAFQYANGERDEDHAAAVLFNAGGLIYNETYHPELNDIAIKE
jgi:hypothetical protein